MIELGLLLFGIIQIIIGLGRMFTEDPTESRIKHENWVREKRKRAHYDYYLYN